MRRLNRYINLPVDWETKSASGFESFLIEGFQFAGVDRDLDKVRWMAGYPFEVLSWPRLGATSWASSTWAGRGTATTWPPSDPGCR